MEPLLTGKPVGKRGDALRAGGGIERTNPGSAGLRAGGPTSRTRVVRGGRGDGSTGPGRLRLTRQQDGLRPPGYGWLTYLATWSGPIQKEPEQLHEAHTAVAISRVPVSLCVDGRDSLNRRPPATGRRPSSCPRPQRRGKIDPFGLRYNAKLRWRSSFRPGGDRRKCREWSDRSEPSLPMLRAREARALTKAWPTETKDRSQNVVHLLLSLRVRNDGRHRHLARSDRDPADRFPSALTARREGALAGALRAGKRIPRVPSPARLQRAPPSGAQACASASSRRGAAGTEGRG